MMRLVRTLLPLAFILFLSACSNKNYFEPEKIQGSVEYDGELPAEIVEISYAGATLENGQVITPEGLQKFKLPKGYRYINRSGDTVLAAADCKPAILFDTATGKSVELSLPRRLVAGMMIPGTHSIAYVIEGNHYGIYDYDKGEDIAKYGSDPAYSADIRIANPIMLDQLVLIPTLDGKLVILNKENGAKIREIVIGKGDETFNNVIYLKVIGNRLVAATPHRIVSISPKIMDAETMEIADVVFIDDAIYITTKDGTVYHCDVNLKILDQKKFPFAHFVGIIYGEYIYLIEREGYIIATDATFTTANVFELPDRIEKWFYATNDRFYYDNYYFKLNRGRSTQSESADGVSEDTGQPSDLSENDEKTGPSSLWEKFKSIFTPDDAKKTTDSEE